MTNTVSTKIRLRVDALNNWQNAGSKPLELGEIGIAYDSVNTAAEGEPAVWEKKNFKIRIGRELSGTHWNDSAELQASDLTTELYQELDQKFWLKSEHEEFAQALEQQFGSEITEIKNRLAALEKHCKEAAVSAQVLYWENSIVPVN